MNKAKEYSDRVNRTLELLQSEKEKLNFMDTTQSQRPTLKNHLGK